MYLLTDTYAYHKPLNRDGRLHFPCLNFAKSTQLHPTRAADGHDSFYKTLEGQRGAAMDSAAGRIAILIPVLGGTYKLRKYAFFALDSITSFSLSFPLTYFAVAICAGMAAFGFKGRVNVVGTSVIFLDYLSGAWVCGKMRYGPHSTPFLPPSPLQESTSARPSLL